MSDRLLPRLAVLGVTTLISILAYGSQILFRFIEPGPLRDWDLWYFNALVIGIWISYARACLVDPGNLAHLDSFKEMKHGDKPQDVDQTRGDIQKSFKVARWCQKCDAYKPPRAHHCKVCKRCIPKMDHHCPWTANCVSHATFPHFIRFLFYSVTAMAKLAQLHFERINIIWNARDLPSYLGPTMTQLSALLMLCALNAMTLFGVGVIFVRTVYSLGANVTAVESWEIERHETLVRRARKHGGVLDGPDGTKIRIQKQEFPYDIGIWSNICQGMNGSPLVWFWPLANTPTLASGIEFEVNGFEDPGTEWPPPDPDKMPRMRRPVNFSEMARELDEGLTDQERLRAFRERQNADVRRRRGPEKVWKNSEGETLGDFGVEDDSVEDSYEDSSESDVEYQSGNVEDDNVPLGELLSRRREKTQ